MKKSWKVETLNSGTEEDLSWMLYNYLLELDTDEEYLLSKKIFNYCQEVKLRRDIIGIRHWWRIFVKQENIQLLSCCKAKKRHLLIVDHWNNLYCCAFETAVTDAPAVACVVYILFTSAGLWKQSSFCINYFIFIFHVFY